jgi:prevent-host-death family protein
LTEPVTQVDLPTVTRSGATMITVNIHEAKAQLSKLIDRVVKGETVIIAKAGKPMVKMTVVEAPATTQRLGFLAGQVEVPDDFDRMG